MRITIDLPLRITEDGTIISSLVLRQEADNWFDLMRICERPELTVHNPGVLEPLILILSDYSRMFDPPAPVKILRERYELADRSVIELDWTISAPAPPEPAT